MLYNCLRNSFERKLGKRNKKCIRLTEDIRLKRVKIRRKTKTIFFVSSTLHSNGDQGEHAMSSETAHIKAALDIKKKKKSTLCIQRYGSIQHFYLEQYYASLSLHTISFHFHPICFC